MDDDGELKVVVLSVVDSADGCYGLIQSWRLASMYVNLRGNRYRLAGDCLPVAAMIVDPDLFATHFGLLRNYPVRVSLEWLAANFGAALICPEAVPPVFKHYSTLRDGGGKLLGVWERAVKLHSVAP